MLGVVAPEWIAQKRKLQLPLLFGVDAGVIFFAGGLVLGLWFATGKKRMGCGASTKWGDPLAQGVCSEPSRALVAEVPLFHTHG